MKSRKQNFQWTEGTKIRHYFTLSEMLTQKAKDIDTQK